MTMLDRRNFINELANHEPVPPAELLEFAKEAFLIAMRDLSLTDAVMENRIAMLCEPVFTSAIDTLAVTAKPGTGIVLAVNPWFFVHHPTHSATVQKTSYQLAGPEERVKAIVHEGNHVEKKHLLTNYTGDAWTLSNEVMCNHDLMSVLKTGMFKAHPVDDAGVVDTSQVVEFGVNPRKIWEKYRDDLKEQGKSYVDYNTFVSSDLLCMSELEKMTKLPQPPRGRKGEWNCSHHQGDGLPFDQDEVDDSMTEVMDTAHRKATVEGDPRFKDALEKLFKQTQGDEKASKIWGDTGIGALFGQVVQKREVKFWAQWLKRNLASRLVPGRKLIFNKRTAAVDHQLRRDPILVYRGKQYRTLLWVEIDSSGSMGYEQLEWVRKYVGEEKNIDVVFHNFDNDRYPVEWGKPFAGRGGTDFSVIEDAYLAAKRKPDAVLVFTDGEAAHIRPRDHHRWIWLITHHGDDWPKAEGMACYKLPPPN
jgi:hypothetical protein